MVRTGKIADVKAKAQNRDPGYVDAVKAHCLLWDEKVGVYQMSEEAWQDPAMKAKWKRKPNRSSDICKYRTCGNCQEGPQCNSSGLDCSYGPGTFEQCKIWRETNHQKQI